MVWLRILRRAALALAAFASIPAVLVGSSLVTASVAYAAPLASIQVSGNVRIDTETIRSYVTVDFGQEFGQADLNDTLGVLFATGFFANVSVTSSGSTIFIAVVENPVVVQITFVGNQKVRDPELVEAIETEVRGVLSEPMLAADVRAIEDVYRQNGRGAAVVQVSVQELEGNLAAVTFNIMEGERVRIADITFEGNEVFSDRQLQSVIETRESSVLTLISKRDVYSPDGLLLDQELLRRFYLQNGHADFQVVGVNVSYDETTFEYTIVISVSEGPRYTFGNIGVDSTIPGVTADTLSRAIHIRSGQVFNALELERSLEDITLALADAGDPFVQVTPRANRNYATNEIDIVFRIDPGERLYVERIDVIGNTRTRDYVVRREAQIAEGDAYNRVLVDRFERRLRALGIFQAVNISVARGSAPDLVILQVMVEEQRTGEVSAVAGYSTVDGILGEISYSESNFLGRGQQLRASFTIGVNNRNFSVSFTEPYFLGRRLPFGFDVYRRTTTASAVRPYGEAQTGGQVRLGLPLSDNSTVLLAYRVTQRTISGTTAPGIYPNGTDLISSISLTLTHSTIDNISNPSQGVFVRAGTEFAGVGGTVSYLRSTLDARWYQPLGQSSLVTLLRFQAGTITGMGGQDVRAFDHFVLGGETVRGFANAGFGPREIGGAEQALGGRTYWAATAELSFPIPFLPEDFGLRGAVFADAGMLFGVDPGAGPALPAFNNDMTLRASVGASLLWASPIGLLRLDYARVLSSATYDVLQAVRFGIGAQF